jgi:F0F1-type ATP synthase membrane subunit b/b'
VGRKKIEQAKAEIAAEHTSLVEKLIPAEISLVNEVAEKLLGEPMQLALDPAKVKHVMEEVS